MDRPERFFSTSQLDQLARLRRVPLIIVGALIFGMLSFFLMTLAIADWDKVSWNLSLENIITLMALAGAFMGIVFSQVIRPIIYRSNPMAGDAPTDQEIEAAQAQFNTELVIRSALLEGPGFFCLMVWMIQANYLALAGAAACTFFLVLNLPRENNHLHDIHRRLTDRS